MVSKLTVLPIPIDELTPLDVASGMTQERRAKIFFPDGRRLDVPAEGAVFNFDPPVDGRGHIKAHLHMYDRQTEDSYFTVEGSPLKVDNRGEATIKFIQRGDGGDCFFVLVDGDWHANFLLGSGSMASSYKAQP